MGDPGAQHQGGRLIARADIRVTHIRELTAQKMLLFAPYVLGSFQPAPSRRFPLTLDVNVTSASSPTGSLAPRAQALRLEHSLDCPLPFLSTAGRPSTSCGCTSPSRAARGRQPASIPQQSPEAAPERHPGPGAKMSCD